MDPKGDDARIVEAIISLAHAMRLDAVVEGVENAEQFGRLREMGCDLVQGSFISRPLESGEIPNLLIGDEGD